MDAEQRGREHEPDGGGFGFLIFCARARRASRAEHAAGQRAQQQPAELSLLLLRGQQAEFRDRARADAAAAIPAGPAAS